MLHNEVPARYSLPGFLVTLVTSQSPSHSYLKHKDLNALNFASDAHSIKRPFCQKQHAKKTPLKTKTGNARHFVLQQGQNTLGVLSKLHLEYTHQNAPSKDHASHLRTIARWPPWLCLGTQAYKWRGFDGAFAPSRAKRIASSEPGVLIEQYTVRARSTLCTRKIPPTRREYPRDLVSRAYEGQMLQTPSANAGNDLHLEGADDAVIQNACLCICQAQRALFLLLLRLLLLR